MASASSGIGTFVGSSAYDPSKPQGATNPTALWIAGIAALAVVVIVATLRK